jgi:hypothetical protein
MSDQVPYDGSRLTTSEVGAIAISAREVGSPAQAASRAAI